MIESLNLDLRQKQIFNQNIENSFEKAVLPPKEGEVRKYKDGDYKFSSGHWKKVKQSEEKKVENKSEVESKSTTHSEDKDYSQDVRETILDILNGKSKTQLITLNEIRSTASVNGVSYDIGKIISVIHKKGYNIEKVNEIHEKLKDEGYLFSGGDMETLANLIEIKKGNKDEVLKSARLAFEKDRSKTGKDVVKEEVKENNPSIATVEQVNKIETLHQMAKDLGLEGYHNMEKSRLKKMIINKIKGIE